MTNAQLHGCAFEGWQCFHCGEIFTTVGGAQDHFGATPQSLAGCQIKAGNERGLLMEIRTLETQNAELKSDMLNGIVGAEYLDLWIERRNHLQWKLEGAEQKARSWQEANATESCVWA